MTSIRYLREIRASNPSPMTLDGTRTYLVGRDRPVVIDPGPADEIHLSGILDALGGVRPAALLLTHAHADHAAGAASLARRTGSPIMMARGALGASGDTIPVDRWLRDGDEIESDVGPVRALATPGHTPEHLAFFWHGPAAPPGGALFAGDLFMGEGDTTLVAPPEGDLGDYLESLEHVRELAPGILLAAHGPPLRDTAAAVQRYIKHRRGRIEQVVEALRADGGAASAGDLVRTIYGPDLHPALAAAAEGSVWAVLRYLEQQGRVREEGEGRYGTAD